MPLEREPPKSPTRRTRRPKPTKETCSCYVSILSRTRRSTRVTGHRYAGSAERRLGRFASLRPDGSASGGSGDRRRRRRLRGGVARGLSRRGLLDGGRGLGCAAGLGHHLAYLVRVRVRGWLGFRVGARGRVGGRGRVAVRAGVSARYRRAGRRRPSSSRPTAWGRECWTACGRHCRAC